MKQKLLVILTILMLMGCANLEENPTPNVISENTTSSTAETVSVVTSRVLPEVLSKNTAGLTDYGYEMNFRGRFVPGTYYLAIYAPTGNGVHTSINVKTQTSSLDFEIEDVPKRAGIYEYVLEYSSPEKEIPEPDEIIAIDQGTFRVDLGVIPDITEDQWVAIMHEFEFKDDGVFYIGDRVAFKYFDATNQSCGNATALLGETCQLSVFAENGIIDEDIFVESQFAMVLLKEIVVDAYRQVTFRIGGDDGYRLELIKEGGTGVVIAERMYPHGLVHDERTYTLPPGTHIVKITYFNNEQNGELYFNMN